MLRCEEVVIFALVVHDLGWVTMQPLIGLPALLAALLLQARLAFLGTCRRSRDVDVAHECAVLAWIVGSCLWTCSEYVFDGVSPAGILANISFLTRLDSARLYPAGMGAAAAVMTVACAWLACLHVTRCSAAVCRRWRFVAARVPLVGESVGNGATFRGVPKQVYEELYLAPWILMDTAWGCINYRATIGIAAPTPAVLLSAAFGTVSIALQLDCLCLSARIGGLDWTDVSVSAAEVLWVLGNILWMLEDVLTEAGNFPTYCIAVSMFAVGALLMGAVVICAAFEAQNSLEAADVTAVTQQAAAADPLADAEAAQRPLPASSSAPKLFETTLTTTPLAPHSPLIQTLNDPTPTSAKEPLKKQRRSRRPRSIWDGVTLLQHYADLASPATTSDSMPDSVRLAAKEALDKLGRARDGPVVLLDLGNVWKGLQRWRKHLPRVQPYFSVRTNANAKVLQLLQTSGCGFACATPKEIDMALAAGAGPDGIMLSEPCKPRMHLSFARQRGVTCMTFDSAAELQKIAAEFPGARLLLRIAAELPTKGSCSAVAASSHCALRASWQGLLDAANAAGLAVVGISLHMGLEQVDAAAWDLSLEAACEALQLLQDNGFLEEDPAFVDLGTGISDANGTTFQHMAAVLHERLSHWLPTDVFGHMVVAADAGPQLSHASTALLTKVLSKDPAVSPVQSSVDSGNTDVIEDCAAPIPTQVKYMVNEGIYGAFSACLCGHVPKPPEPLLKDDAVVATSVPQPCSILGPSGTSLDVISSDASLPELEAGDWLLWRQLGNTPSTQTVVWHYTEDIPSEVISEVPCAKESASSNT